MHRCPSVCPSVCLSLYQKSLDNNSLEKNLEVKGHMGQGQRSRGSRSNEGSKQRQVGSRQRQVASLWFNLKQTTDSDEAAVLQNKLSISLVSSVMYATK